MPRKRHKPEEIVAKLGRSWAATSTACRRASRSVLVEIVGHLNRQNRPTRPRLSMPARCRLDQASSQFQFRSGGLTRLTVTDTAR